MASNYAIQIVEKATGHVAASWDPGLADEQQFVASVVADTVERMRGQRPSQAVLDDILARVKAKGVGAFMTEAHVLQDVELAIREHWDAGGAAPNGESLERYLEASLRAFLYALKQRV
jgi:hypothetical protein